MKKLRLLKNILLIVPSITLWAMLIIKAFQEDFLAGFIVTLFTMIIGGICLWGYIDIKDMEYNSPFKRKE